MKVTCPNCETKYNLPDAAVPETGAKVRCTRCHHVFHVDKSQPAPPAPQQEPDFAAEQPAEPGSGTHDEDVDDLFGDVQQPAQSAPEQKTGDADIDDLFDDVEKPAEPAPAGETKAGDADIDDLFGPDDAAKPEPETIKAETGGEDIEDLFGAPADKPKDEEKFDQAKPVTFETEKKGLGKGGFNLAELAKSLSDKDAKTGKSSSAKLAGLIAAAVIALAAIAGGAMYALKLGPFAPPKTEAVAEKAPPKPEEKKADESFKNLILVGVRQYMVENQKAGSLFVVEGKIKNNGTAPKEYIKVEATIFDDKGASLATKQLVAGNTVSYFQLQMLSAEELEAALTSQVGILTTNVNVRTGGEVPFMIAFVNPPANLQEFTVKVVDAKDPAP